MYVGTGTQHDMLKFFKDNLPSKPYCTDELNYGLQIRPTDIAIGRKYIQPNKPTDLRWLAYDIDRGGAAYWFIWEELEPCPEPNVIIENKENGHAHYLYALEVPVYLHSMAKKNPIHYVAAIDVALTHQLQADPNYSKLIIKNPLHSNWNTVIQRDVAYDLNELADYLNLKKIDRRRRLEPIGLGRNCDLFDMTRLFAYREIRKPQDDLLFPIFDTETTFVNYCIEYARRHNKFTEPLPDSECCSIGKSVGRWVWRNMSPEGFRQWCSRKGACGGRKSGVVRQKKVDEKARLVKEYKLSNPDASVRQIANEFNISIGSVSKYLRLC